MVTIVSNNLIEDNGTLDMANMLYQACTYEDGDYTELVLDFGIYDGESFYEEGRSWANGPQHELGRHFSDEQCKEWQATQRVVFPAIQVSRISYGSIIYNDGWGDKKGLEITIESDNDEAVRNLFLLFADLGNGGHSFGGLVRLNNQTKENIGSFGFDGDGCDQIFFINEECVY